MGKQDQIRFDRPAAEWHEGCPLGNGRMGQMVYGGIAEEKIDLSHLTFFSGSDTVNPYRENGAEAFQKAREAALRGDYAEVSAQTENMMGMRGNYGTNLPVGSLRIAFEGISPEEEPSASKLDGASSYSRSLDIREGLVQTQAEWDDGSKEQDNENTCQEHCAGSTAHRVIRREAFSSHPDQVFAMEMTDSSENGVCCRITFDGGRCPFRTIAGTDWMEFEVQALEPVHSDGTEGVCLAGRVRVCTEDGKGTVEAGTAENGSAYLRVSGTNRAVLYLAMETDFLARLKEDGSFEPKGGFDWIDRAALAQRTSMTAADYPQLKARHCEDIRGYMDRVSLNLGITGENTEMKETGEQLRDAVRGGADNSRLTELMFQYGRYLLLSSSREDSPLPAPLQGVWNDDVACQIGWTCDMHLDITTQMNYWISEPGRLGESHQPLFAWMERILIPHGREAARRCYGMNGWTGELVSNAWGYAAPYWNKALSPCPTGGVWQASDYAEHYRYGQDEAFRMEHALPVLEEAVDFVLEYLFEGENGELWCGPSISPENVFAVNGKKQYASLNPTYEVLMIRELLTEYLELAESGESAVRRQERILKAKDALKRLPSYRVKPDGTLAEWAHDYEAADRQHRHTSHLLGLFPYAQITPEETPDLAKAAAASIQDKLTPYENWEDTGWARSLLVLYSARLHNEKETSRHLRSMQTVLTGPNLLVMHPPTRGTATSLPVYELDGNTGFSMGVMEALIQSHNGCIRLLPALPPEWKNGSLRGAAARGGLVLDLDWKDGKLTEVWVYARKEQQTAFAFGKESPAVVSLKSGKQRIL